MCEDVQKNDEFRDSGLRRVWKPRSSSEPRNPRLLSASGRLYGPCGSHELSRLHTGWKLALRDLADQQLGYPPALRLHTGTVVAPEAPAWLSSTYPREVEHELAPSGCIGADLILRFLTTDDNQTGFPRPVSFLVVTHLVCTCETLGTFRKAEMSDELIRRYAPNWVHFDHSAAIALRRSKSSAGGTSGSLIFAGGSSDQHHGAKSLHERKLHCALGDGELVVEGELEQPVVTVCLVDIDLVD